MRNRAAWAEIDLGALEHNYRAIKSCIKGNAKLCAVVKADAYGHGAIETAKVALAEGADYLAVATISEGIELREAGFKAPILLLGLILPEEAALVVEHDITQAVCELPLAKALSEAAAKLDKTAKIHLKVETGMGRIGARPEEMAELAEAVSKLPHVEIEGMFSHFATADCKDKTFAQEQLKRFLEACKAVQARGIDLKIRHIAESAAILEMPEAHLDMVRAGVIQYGMWPSEEVTHPVELKPVMKLCAQIVFLKKMHPGETIGYGRAWEAKRESLIATLPLGYADGYIRAYGKGGAKVLVNGQLVSVAGRVCMDQVMVDVTDLPEVHEGDMAVLFGAPELTVDDAARVLDTINYEVTCLVSARIPRVYVHS